MLTQETKELILNDVKALGNIEKLGGTLLQVEEEKVPFSSSPSRNEERPAQDWSNLLIRQSQDRSSSGDSFGHHQEASVESVSQGEVDGMNRESPREEESKEVSIGNAKHLNKRIVKSSDELRY